MVQISTKVSFVWFARVFSSPPPNLSSEYIFQNERFHLKPSSPESLEEL
jgi:hypothetical protein